jgi:hypothetical protein
MTATLILFMRGIMPPDFRSRVTPLATSISALWRGYRRRTGLAREAITLMLGLFAGLVLLPLCIYGVGRLLLGPYTRSATETEGAGPWALWMDFLNGLGRGSLAHWLIAVGPYVLYLIVRLGRRRRR